ncbi:MAG: FAD binding domain-containing protein [Alphaproteobacteria bacterium]|nr:FAD binding domain-containing protein [Alphaproteobacteria bacterium]
MKPAAFDYLRPADLDEALAALHEHGADAKVMAGGQSLMPMLNMRLLAPGVIVDIADLEPLRTIEASNGAIEIGAATTQAALGEWPELVEKAPLLAKALPNIGHFQTRNRGTVCGSLAHSDPSSELPLCLATLGGEVVLQSRDGTRNVAAADFQTAMLTTDCGPQEMVVAARFPVAVPGAGYAFAEITRRHGDFAIVALAAMVDGDTVRLGVGGVADTPQVREWQGLANDAKSDALDDALNAFAWEMGGSDDVHATARYRREIVRRIGRKVIAEAADAADR